MRKTYATTILAVATLCLLLAARESPAQGGPPMVTDDPETPGDGKWEINLAAFGDRLHSGRKEVSVPDADINYGLGDRIQLKLDVPWSFAKESGEGWQSGLGTANAGVKWRFVDGGEDGISISTYPQYLSGWSASSRRRGVASSEHELFLPVEIAGAYGGWSLDAEAGRELVRGAGNPWAVGAIAAHGCGGERGECLFEVHERIAPHETQTLVNLGLRWKLLERASLLASAGREFGSRADDRQDFAFYLGIQLLR